MSGSSSLTLTRSGDDYVVILEGRATMQEGPAFHAFVSQTLDHVDEPTLVLCINGCEYMDSTFLGGLISLHKKYSTQPAPRFIVAASADSRARLLASSRLDLILHLVEEAPESCGTCVQLPTPPVESREFTLHAIKCHRLLAEVGGPQAAVFQLVADQLAKELEPPQVDE